MNVIIDNLSVETDPNKYYPPVPASEIKDIKRIVDNEIERFDSYLQKYDNWAIFKLDTKQLSRWKTDTDKDPEVYWMNNLFGPIELIFEDGYASPMIAETRGFNSELERSNWLKEDRPLIYCLMNTRYTPIDNETFEPINDEPPCTKFLVRYFKEIGKLPMWKYYLQFIIGKYNFSFIRPALYRLLVVK